jgi:hypothetical protein
MSNTLILQELKRLILVKMGIRVISPSDCRVISIAIQKQLKKNISETTIKRLFGFAEIKHEFSKFTINTLKEYVEMVNDAVIGSKITAPQTDSDASIDHIRAQATSHTNSTLQNISNRCSVPYELTIPREFATYDLDFFRNSKYSYTGLISPPGYGKSILLSHLIKELYLGPQAVFKDDIVLFLNADQLFKRDWDELSLEDRIKLKLGLYHSINLIDYFNEQWKTNGIKFVLIIDGFSELVINKTTKPRIFDSIIGFIANIGQDDSIKLILSMRSITWSRFHEKIRHSHFFKSKWFSGSHFNPSDNSNIPPLTEIEVEKIFKKMSSTEFSKVSESLKLQLKFPFHIQWYYQLKEEYPAFESYTNIVYYEIIARFIEEKIYNSTYATEKILFCKKIIQLTNYGRRGYSVSKTDLIKDMPVFQNAYDELLSHGILMEEKQLKDGLPIEYVHFIQPHTFEYFLFIELYDIFNHKLDKKFFELVNNEYTGNQVRFQLLQWAVRLLVKLRSFDHLEAVLNLNLNNYEKNYLIYFIAENLNYNAKKDPELILSIKEQKLHSLLIKKLVHFDFIDSCYKDAINSLLEIADTQETTLFYNSILAIFDCLSLDRIAIEQRLAILKKLSPTKLGWAIEPYDFVSLIYFKIKGIKVAENKTLAWIEDFKNGKTGELVHDTFPNATKILTYLMLFIVNVFYGSPKEAIKIIERITDSYPKLKKSRRLFSIFLLGYLAQANAKVNPGRKTDQMERILTQLFASDIKNNLTPYLQSIFLMLKTLQSFNRKDYQNALKYAEECLHLFSRNNIAINELYLYNLISNIYTSLGNQNNVDSYNHLKYKLWQRKGLDRFELGMK